jgi:hypothetical protein
MENAINLDPVSGIEKLDPKSYFLQKWKNDSKSLENIQENAEILKNDVQIEFNYVAQESQLSVLKKPKKPVKWKEKSVNQWPILKKKLTTYLFNLLFIEKRFI